MTGLSAQLSPVPLRSRRVFLAELANRATGPRAGAGRRGATAPGTLRVARVLRLHDDARGRRRRVLLGHGRLGGVVVDVARVGRLLLLRVRRGARMLLRRVAAVELLLAVVEVGRADGAGRRRVLEGSGGAGLLARGWRRAARLPPLSVHQPEEDDAGRADHR